jgi:Flp pilus assembly protein TadB
MRQKESTIDMSSQTNTWEETHKDLIDILRYIPTFFKNPVQAVRAIPNWNWLALIVFNVLFSAVCGLIRGLFSGNSIFAVINAVVSPITTTIFIMIVAGFFYYVIMFWQGRQLDFRRLTTLVLLASLPTNILTILLPVLPPINLVGILFTGLLIIVGLVDHFQIPRKPVMQMMGVLFVFYIFVWVGNMITAEHSAQKREVKALPESLDILEKELGK